MSLAMNTAAHVTVDRRFGKPTVGKGIDNAAHLLRAQPERRPMAGNVLGHQLLRGGR